MVWETPKNVVVAHGPQREYINILNEADFKKWHKRGGLRFIDCQHPCHIVDRKNASLHLSHNAQGEGERCAEDRARRGPGPFMKAMIREWITSLRQAPQDPPAGSSPSTVSRHPR